MFLVVKPMLTNPALKEAFVYAILKCNIETFESVAELNTLDWCNVLIGGDRNYLVDHRGRTGLGKTLRVK